MRHSLATRLSLLILAICSGVMLLAGVGMLGYTYSKELGSIRRTQADIRDAHLPGLTAAAWDLSQARMAEELDAILALRHVASVQLHLPEGKLEAGDPQAPAYQRIQLPLTHEVGGEIGQVAVVFSRHSLWSAVRTEARTLLGYLGVIFAVTAGAVLVAFRVLVTRHLNALARYTRSLSMETLDRDFAFNRHPRSSSGDELDNLLGAVHEMRHNLSGEIEGRRRAEESLRRTEQSYQEVFNATGDALFIHGEDGRLLDVNETMLRMFGCTREEALALGVEGLSPGTAPFDGTNVREHLQQVRESGESLFQWQARRMDGTLFWVEVSLKATQISSRPHVIASVRDISMRKEMEEQLHHSRRMDAVGQLAGGVAHDFNNMLAGIMGATELLRMQPGCQTEQGHELTGMILEAGARAADLTHKLLAFSRKGRVESSTFDVHSAVGSVASILSHTLSKKIRIVQELAAPRSRVVGDQTALQNALLNLGINAGHAMPEGGQLTLRSRVVRLSEADCQASRFELAPGDHLEIDIHDTGCGIAPENLDRIFEPFFTTRPLGEGTGLGLAAVYGTLASHHGAVRVESELGRGTRFLLLLPLGEGGAEPVTTPTVVPVGSGRVLVVDDEAVIRTTASALLEGWGYEVLTAANGREALDVLEQMGGGVDLVLLDMVMPEMDGRECFLRIRRRHPETRVLLSSGFNRDVDVDALRKQGLRGHLRKPWRAAELAAAVAEALGGGDQHPAGA